MIKVKRYLPKSLLGRFVLIFVLPVVMAQVIAIYVFFYFYIDVNSRNVSRLYTSQILLIKDSYINSKQSRLKDYMKYTDIVFYPNFKNLDKLTKIDDSSWRKEGFYSYFNLLPLIDPYNNFKQFLRQSGISPFSIYELSEGKDSILLKIPSAKGDIHFEILKKRIHSSSKYVFVLWMIFSSLLGLAIAIIFLKNQLRPIAHLSEAARRFGKGDYSFNIKPSGSSEVRSLTRSFRGMSDRVSSHISQRTDMLSGVSHDLRTPLTRMKLAIEMSGGDEGMKGDIKDMEDLIEEYLDFAKNQQRESFEKVGIDKFLQEEVLSGYLQNERISYESEGLDGVFVRIRKMSYKRSLVNLVENALKYADDVRVGARLSKKNFMVVVDDNGPGIPLEHRSKVLEPFYRVDGARNLDKKKDDKVGSGLGLAIANDNILSHGGRVRLFESPKGGLRVIIFIPIK